MAVTEIRSWQDESRNKLVRVFYEDVPDRRITYEVTPLDPAGNMLGGGRPTDGLNGGDSLGTFCEGSTQVRLTAKNFAPFAEFVAVPDSPDCLGGGTGNPAAGTFLRFICRGVDRYRLTADGNGGELETLFETNSTTCGYEPPVVDPVCRNPDADNYVSEGPADVLLCTFSPKLTLDPVPDLVALGRPVPVALHSAAILWPDYTPAAALAYITVEGPAAGALLVVNGERLEVGEALQPGRFQDAETLLEALLALPLLTAAYTIRLNDDVSVVLQAKELGRAHNLTVSASTTPGLSVAMVSGRDMVHSQRRTEYGCWLEVYAVPAAVFGPGQQKTGGVLAGAFESRYREDNTYQFDIAECLRQYTSLDYDVSGRITGYFLRYGETYADAPGGFRRKRRVGESNVLFALEAVEIMPPAVYVDGSGVNLGLGFPYELPIAFDGSGGGAGTLAGWRRLSRRPGLVGMAACLTTVLNPTYGGQLQLSKTRRLFNSVSYSDSTPFAEPGQVANLQADVLQPSADVERIPTSIGGVALLSGVPVPAGATVLTFANGQGGNESVAFPGEQEPVTKRTVSFYATTTGTRTRQAELPEAFRVGADLLAPDVYAWLVAELGNTAAVWLETAAGPVPVNLSDFDATADPVTGQYSLSVVVEPCEQPARGLTN